MARKKTLTALFDSLGAGGLLLAGLSLLNATAVLPLAPAAHALQFFALSFFGAVLAFGLARMLQIAQVVRQRRDPRRERAQRKREEPVAVDAAEPAPHPLQRAA